MPDNTNAQNISDERFLSSVFVWGYSVLVLVVLKQDFVSFNAFRSILMSRMALAAAAMSVAIFIMPSIFSPLFNSFAQLSIAIFQSGLLLSSLFGVRNAAAPNTPSASVAMVAANRAPELANVLKSPRMKGVHFAHGNERTRGNTASSSSDEAEVEETASLRARSRENLLSHHFHEEPETGSKRAETLRQA